MPDFFRRVLRPQAAPLRASLLRVFQPQAVPLRASLLRVFQPQAFPLRVFQPQAVPLWAFRLRVLRPQACHFLHSSCTSLREQHLRRGRKRRCLAWAENRVKTTDPLFGSDLFQASVLRRFPAARMANRCS